MVRMLGRQATGEQVRGAGREVGYEGRECKRLFFFRASHTRCPGGEVGRAAGEGGYLHLLSENMKRVRADKRHSAHHVLLPSCHHLRC